MFANLKIVNLFTAIDIVRVFLLLKAQIWIKSYRKWMNLTSQICLLHTSHSDTNFHTLFLTRHDVTLWKFPFTILTRLKTTLLISVNYFSRLCDLIEWTMISHSWHWDIIMWLRVVERKLTSWIIRRAFENVDCFHAPSSLCSSRLFQLWCDREPITRRKWNFS